MIRDDADPAPSRAQQAADTINDRVDLGVDLTNKQRVEGMPEGVELAGLSPTTGFASYSHPGLILSRISTPCRAITSRSLEAIAG